MYLLSTYRYSVILLPFNVFARSRNRAKKKFKIFFSRANIRLTAAVTVTAGYISVVETNKNEKRNEK